MTASIGHRGPDEIGEYSDDYLQLGVVRLSIIDLKGGSQPSRSNGLVTVFNGEIYNYLQLRSDLPSDSFEYDSESDAAVINPALRRWGKGAFERMRGMFALASWNTSERRLVLARDRFGIKPLYIASNSDYLIFSSEIKGILESKLVQPSIDRRSLSDLFSLSYPFPPRTMFENIYELLPSHWREYQAGDANPKEARYWAIPFVPESEKKPISRTEASQQLRDLMRSSVYEHLQSDVPLASYLSGGVDSAAIAALVTEVTGDPPITFSIGFDRKEHDERAAAAETANHLGAVNHVVECTASIAEDYKNVVRAMELPLQFPLALPYYALSRELRSEGFKVALTGEGADEVFGGYDQFLADKVRRVFGKKPLSWFKRPAYQRLYGWLGAPAGLVEMLIANHEKSRPIASNFLGHWPIWFDAWAALLPDRDRLLDFPSRPIETPPLEFASVLPANYASLEATDAALALEQRTRLPGWILQIGDRASMANGVEARTPFLDHRIAEFVASVPTSFKIRRFTVKSILRDSVADLLPRPIAQRAKRPFYTPIRDWFFSETSPEYFQHVLNPAAIASAGYFSPDVTQKLLGEMKKSNVLDLAQLRREWLLVLVLGTQILHDEFVAPLN